ncbi:MAG: amino acid ABC transporter permease [Alphaproteobacteria bacterium]|nr:amino acid ABC transporter permease [Alphaproteobacteria bacterium]
MASTTLTTETGGFKVRRLWTDERSRSIIFQLLVVLGLALFIAFIVSNTIANLQRAGLASGFGFLTEPAFFDINQRLIQYTSESTFGRALIVGLLNTILVSALGIVAATLLGFSAGVMRLSQNWILSRLVTAYVEMTRNVPVLLQIIFWWSILTELPKVRDSLSLGGAFILNNRGVRMPSPVLEPGFGWVFGAFIVGAIATFLVAKWAKRRQDETGQTFPMLWVGLGLLIGLPVIVHFILGQPLAWDMPERMRFNYRGGFNITPELIALWFALSTYTGAFISENVRAGIMAVSKGQSEAAFALGLRPNQTMRMIIIPQAMRVIIPPLTSQFLNLTKNSSLAIAIGYQDLVSIGGTILNQSGQALEVVAIWMGVYLSLSLLMSGYMNWYNKRIALVER